MITMTHTLTRREILNTRKKITDAQFKKIITLSTLIVCLVMPLIGAKGSDMFDFMERTQGNTYIGFKYFSIIFTAVQWIVTLAGLLIIALKVMTMAASIVVLTNPPIFDLVHTKKVGLQGIKKGNGGEANTKDLIFYYLSYIIPDFLAVSSFSHLATTPSNNTSSKATSDKYPQYPTIGEYVKEDMVSFILITLVGAMLFSGQTQRIVANFARGGQTVAEKIATADISGMVDRALNSGKDFKFVYGNSIEGDNKKKLSEKIYAAAKGAVPEARDTDYLTSLGSKIQQGIDSYIPGIQDGYSNPSLQYKVSFVENADNVKELSASDDGFGGQAGLKKISLSSISSVPKSPPSYYSTGAIIIEYTAQKSSSQGTN